MSRTAWILLVSLALIALAGGLTVWRAESRPPTVAGAEEIFVAREAEAISLALADAGSGLRDVRVVLSHARGEAALLERSFGGNLLLGGGPAEETAEVAVDAEALGLRDGDAFLRVEVRDWSWRNLLGGNRTALDLPVTIDLTPPRVRIQSGLTYVRRGGSAAVAYRLNEPTRRDGVEVEEVFFAGHAWPAGGPDCAPEAGGASPCRFALFAVPVTAPENPGIRVVAEDRAGNRTAAGWATRVQERSFPVEPVRLPPRFLVDKIPELSAALGIDASDPVRAFQEINTRVRAENERRIRSLVADASVSEALWDGGFQQLRNSKVTSRFAERRRYLVEGEEVSKATHYGYDLASTARAPVGAANAGRVIFAGDLGIYGDTVLVDHGLGLVTLYGHLSRIDVAEGDSVRKGRTLGLSGATGLAGGDHLHFAILVGESYVDPREWWDPRWVREHVSAKMGPQAATP